MDYSCFKSLSLEETIERLEISCPQVEDKSERRRVCRLLVLCKDLKETKSIGVFQKRYEEIFTILHKHPGVIGYSWDKWAILTGLLTECYLRNLINTKIAVQLITKLKTYKFLTMYVNWFRREFRVDRTWKFTSDQEKAVQFAATFMHFTNKLRITIHGRRVVDFVFFGAPVRFIFDSLEKTPLFIIALLRYSGALLSNARIHSRNIPGILKCVLCKILSLLPSLKLLDVHSIEHSIQQSEFSESIKNLCQCFSILVKDTMNPHEVTYYLANEIQVGGIPNLREILLYGLYDKLFPNCFYGWHMPSSLQHLCRFVVRKTLYDNFNLPEAVDELPISYFLEDYINLIEN